MKNFIKKYIPEEAWRMPEIGWDSERQAVHESQFALGNGFIGNRGILEEVPFDASPGTYIAGVYDKMGSKVADLVSLPCPSHFKVSIKGEKLDVSIMPSVKHERYLNMKEGLLSRHSVYKTVHGHRIDYQSVRFFSMEDKNLMAMRVYITPVNKACTIAVDSGLNTSISNVSDLSEGRKRHFEIKGVDISDLKTVSYVRAETMGSKISVAYASTLHISVGNDSWFSNEDHLELHLRKNQTAVFTKIYSIVRKDQRDLFDIKSRTIKTLNHGVALGFDKLIKRHSGAWEELWKRSDVRIEGSPEMQPNLRFNIYHMLISGVDNAGYSSIGAKTLSGEGYRGHVFWDLEIFMLPFYIFTNPHIARSLLLYRVNRLDQARQIARSERYKGAMFPWESALTGEEETPTWARNLDGSVIRIRTNEFEHHITADIAYAVYKYYIATDDEEFMLEHGYELLFETARFWASRVKFNKNSKKFEIRHVIGPDEFHEDVNNNVYTNILAKWNIYVAYSMYMKLNKKFPERLRGILHKIGMQPKETKKWRDIFNRMYIRARKDKVIEQFDGFFKRKHVKITEVDENFMPLIPASVELAHIGRYQLLKQADMIMIMYLIPEWFDRATKKANYDFYASRTVHKSSLSPSVHSIVAADLGWMDKAYRFFMISLNTDIDDPHRNTSSGIHAANLGGTWQVVINGFAGIKVFKETLCVEPALPSEIKGLMFNIFWKGYVFEITVNRKSVKIKNRSYQKVNNTRKKHMKPSKEKMKIKVYGKLYNVVPGKVLRVKKGA